MFLTIDGNKFPVEIGPSFEEVESNLKSGHPDSCKFFDFDPNGSYVDDNSQELTITTYPPRFYQTNPGGDRCFDLTRAIAEVRLYHKSVGMLTRSVSTATPQHFLYTLQAVFPTYNGIKIMPFEWFEKNPDATDQTLQLMKKISKTGIEPQAPPSFEIAESEGYMLGSDCNGYLGQLAKYCGQKAVSVQVCIGGDKKIDGSSTTLYTPDIVCGRLNTLMDAVDCETRFSTSDSQYFKSKDYVDSVKAKRYGISAQGWGSVFHDQGTEHALALAVPGSDIFMQKIYSNFADAPEYTELLGLLVHNVQHQLGSAWRYVFNEYSDNYTSTIVNQSLKSAYQDTKDWLVDELKEGFKVTHKPNLSQIDDFVSRIPTSRQLATISRTCIQQLPKWSTALQDLKNTNF